MKNVSIEKKWNAGLVQLHVEPPPTPMIKSKHNDKSDLFEMKLRRDPTSENSDLYESKMALFYNGYQEDSFVCSYFKNDS